MPRAYVRIKQIKFDAPKFGKTLEQKMERFHRNAAREWVRAVVKSIPVWSGFALGSVKFAEGMGGNLSRYLNIAIPITPVPKAPRWYYHDWKDKRIQKIAINAGRFASFNFSSTNHVFRFRFRSDVIHLIINDNYSSFSPTSPWFAMERANRAYKNFVNKHIQEVFPSLKQFVTVTETVFGA